tara:strand:+ start:167 stop:388 length:222 start_codon:yes stop_codon:yes gene_type:complete
MIIKDFDSLYGWLDANYDKITDKQYVNLLRESIGVYEFDKPKNKKMCLSQLKTFWYKYGHLEETPIFLDINNI